MEPRLIVMLTHHDRTVQDAMARFEECSDLAVQYWGFKDVGLPVDEMKQLVKAIKGAGKTAVLEVVTYGEEDCLRAARLAVECEFDYLAGTIFYPSVLKVARAGRLKYMPFCGKVSGNPSVLEGAIGEIIGEARKLMDLGVDGFDLLAYRHVGDGERLAQEFVREIKAPVIIAGSIDSIARLNRMKEIDPWGFTIGGAFFDKKFVPNGTFRQQIERVANYLSQ